MRLIREGQRSRQVADIQARLRSFGLEIDDEPGVFGRSTLSAVRAFQQQRNVLIDGIVGPNTWSELVEATWQLGDRDLYLKQPPMRGDDVKDLQGRLNALGFDAGKQDGIFGVDTDHAVRAFQKEYAVAGDGIFGVRSYAALLGLRVDRPATAAGLREELKRLETGGTEGRRVVIDPGHGGDDPGDRGVTGLSEADVCWDLAVKIAGRLASAGARVRFTRIETEAPDASRRADRANAVEADVLVSIHLNSHDEQTAEGASTYHFPTSSAGEALAESIRYELVSLGLRDCRSHARNYPILRETRMPAVLVEPAFITNPDEAKKLEDAEFVTHLANAITRGITRYFEAGVSPG